MGLKYFSAFLLLSSLPLLASSTPLLAIQQEKIEIDKKLDALKAKNLKYDWIKPIIASYSYSISDQFSVENKSRYFRISLDQPIFKSGGIYFALQYAHATKEFTELTTSLKEKNLIKRLYMDVLRIQEIDIEIKKLALQVKNASLDITRKEEQFRSGLLDSSFLDRAILSKSIKEQLLLDAKQRRFSLLQAYKNLSDVDYTKITLPHFKEVDEKEFIAKNLELQQSKQKQTQARYLKNMTISNYLPTLSLTGEYSHKKDSFRLFAQNNESKSYGLRVSMPLFDINRGRNIEIKKLEYLKSKLEQREKEDEIKRSFQTFLNKIETLKQREALAYHDSQLYDRLVRVAKEGLRAGDKSVLDVQTLENSQQIASLDAQIFAIKQQETFLELYTKMSDEI